MGKNKEIFDAELLAIKEEMTRFNQWGHRNKHYTIFSDSRAAIQRCQNDERGPGQAMARSIIDASQVMLLNGNMVTLQWVPGH
jgi:hypothetical protein